MKEKLIKSARYVLSAALLGTGCYLLFQSLRDVVTRFDHDWAQFASLFPLALLVSGVFIASGYFVLRQRYRSVAIVWIVIASALVCVSILRLPGWLGFDSLLDANRSTPSSLLGAILHLGSFIVAFYVARLIYRAALRRLDRSLLRDLPS